MDPQHFNRLLRRIATDSSAFKELYDAYYSKIKLHVHRRFGKLISADDIAQDVFVSLLTLKPESDIIYPTTWLMRLADNHATDLLRLRHEEIALTENIQVPFSIDNAILHTDLQAVLKHLDPLSQQIIYLHVWEGYSHQEIAEELHITCTNVRVRMSRAYKIIKNFL